MNSPKSNHKRHLNQKHEYELRIFSKSNKHNPSLPVELLRYVYDALKYLDIISEKRDTIFLQLEHKASQKSNKLRKRIYLVNQKPVKTVIISKKQVRQYFFKPQNSLRGYKYKFSYNTERISNKEIKEQVESLSLRKRVELSLDIREIIAQCYPSVQNPKHYCLKPPIIAFDMVKRVPYTNKKIEVSEIEKLFKDITPVHSIEIDFTLDRRMGYQKMLKTHKLLADFLNQIFINYEDENQ